MSAITKERIELFIKNPLDNGLTRGEQMELARIALTSLEAEPVAYIIQDSDARSRGEKGILRYFANISDEDINEYEITVTPLYAAPPAPVVPEEKPMPNPLSMYAVDAVAAIAEVRGWNACRAAMLQSGNFRENKNSSTNNFREIAETSTNYPVIPSEVLSAIQKVAKIRADFDDFDGDRRGIGDCLDEAEQELIVTINKYASQLAVVLVGLDERAAFNAWNNEENLPIAGVSAKNAAWLAWQARAELGRSLAVNSPVTPDGWISCSERTSGKQVIELTMLVKQLVSQLKKAKPDCKLPDRAMDYLLRNGLISVEGVLR
ncbi:Eaa protein [Escherichia coli]|nr:Eaa protein [Escherichia coli]